MSEAKKKLFGLFRSLTTSEKGSKLGNEKDREKEKERERPHRRRERPSTKKRPDRSYNTLQFPSVENRKLAEGHDSVRTSSPPAASLAWPPTGFPRDGNLSQGKAMELIASGTPIFKGHRHAIPHASGEYYLLYATIEEHSDAGSDRRELYNGAFAADTFRIQGEGQAAHPWETLEQPSMEFCYGTRTGTVTLNHWVSLSGNPKPSLELRDPGFKPREVEFSTILERLIFLENGFEEDYEELMYKNLYKNLLRDPDKYMNPHKAMEKQIADLIIVLSRPEWIDFSKPENQVAAKYFTNAMYTDRRRYKTFFHQLLLSMELDFRINSKKHSEWAKEKLIAQLPPCIAWDLALARRWHECMTIENFKTAGDTDKVRFHLRAKKAQVKALRKFARTMKWPNLNILNKVLEDTDPDAKALEDRSSDTMSYFTKIILPGPTLPWLLMNTLIDCDDDARELTALTHMHPNSGFQYKSTTYWSANSIIGKVIAPTCHELCGWVGPARPAPDLGRVQIARLRQRKPKHAGVTPGDVKSMTIRSDPLGPPADSYPIAEYKLLLPDEEFIVNTIRIEKLALKPISSSSSPSPDSSGRPKTYDAAVQFAIDGRSWPLRLSYDVWFLSAAPCARGPHPLFFDYVYTAVKVDEILSIKDWGGANAGRPVSSAGASSTGPRTSGVGLEAGEPLGGRTGEAEAKKSISSASDDEREKVLVIEAFGVADNEVLARAWCSHWGLSAVVAEIERTCMACAIREAYAACLNVVILVRGRENEDA